MANVALILIACMAVSVSAYGLGYVMGKLHRRAYNIRHFISWPPSIDHKNIDWTGSIGRSREDCDFRMVPGGGPKV